MTAAATAATAAVLAAAACPAAAAAAAAAATAAYPFRHRQLYAQLYGNKKQQKTNTTFDKTQHQRSDGWSLGLPSVANIFRSNAGSNLDTCFVAWLDGSNLDTFLWFGWAVLT